MSWDPWESTSFVSNAVGGAGWGHGAGNHSPARGEATDKADVEGRLVRWDGATPVGC
jgi:hypothetical protein